MTGQELIDKIKALGPGLEVFLYNRDLAHIQEVTKTEAEIYLDNAEEETLQTVIVIE